MFVRFAVPSISITELNTHILHISYYHQYFIKILVKLNLHWIFLQQRALKQSKYNQGSIKYDTKYGENWWGDFRTTQSITSHKDMPFFYGHIKLRSKCPTRVTGLNHIKCTSDFVLLFIALFTVVVSCNWVMFNHY